MRPSRVSFVFALFMLPAVALALQPGGLRSNDAAEIAALHDKVNTILAYQGSYWESVHWTLGTVAVVAFALVAYNWYSNRELHARDMRLLEEKIAAGAAAQEAQFKSFREAVERDLAQATKAMQEVQQLRDGLSSLRDDYLWERCQQLVEKGDHSSLPTEALYNYSRALEIAPKVIAPDTVILDALRGIRTRLSDLKEVDDHTASMLNDAFAGVPAKYEASVAGLRAEIAAKVEKPNHPSS